MQENKQIKKVVIKHKKSKVKNIAFDITHTKNVTGLITEKDICEDSTEGKENQFKQKA